MPRALGLVLIGVGAAGAAIAGVMIAKSRSATSAATAGLGRATGKRRSGMKLAEHVSRTMDINERVGILQDLTHRSMKDPEMRRVALQVTKNCRARDGLCEARAIYEHTRKTIRYTGDIAPHKHGRNGAVEGIDVFQTAARTSQFGGGDCDDHSIYNCTLALQNGLPCKYRVTSPTKKNEEDYGHIYAMVGLPKNNPRRWVALDTTLPGQNFGREAPYGKALDFVA